MNTFITWQPLLSSILTGKFKFSLCSTIRHKEFEGNGRLQLSIHDGKLHFYVARPDLDHHMKKLQCLGGRVGESNISTLATIDPYQFQNAEWVDDIFMWPPVEFPSLCMYFIDAPGGCTREKLMAYKSLEAYDYMRGLLP